MTRGRKRHVERRWAIRRVWLTDRAPEPSDDVLLGRHSTIGGCAEDPTILTYTTRRAARAHAAHGNELWGEHARYSVVRVEVTVREVGR